MIRVQRRPVLLPAIVLVAGSALVTISFLSETEQSNSTSAHSKPIPGNMATAAENIIPMDGTSPISQDLLEQYRKTGGIGDLRKQVQILIQNNSDAVKGYATQSLEDFLKTRDPIEKYMDSAFQKIMADIAAGATPNLFLASELKLEPIAENQATDQSGIIAVRTYENPFDNTMQPGYIVIEVSTLQSTQMFEQAEGLHPAMQESVQRYKDQGIAQHWSVNRYSVPNTPEYNPNGMTAEQLRTLQQRLSYTEEHKFVVGDAPWWQVVQLRADGSRATSNSYWTNPWFGEGRNWPSSELIDYSASRRTQLFQEQWRRNDGVVTFGGRENGPSQLIWDLNNNHLRAAAFNTGVLDSNPQALRHNIYTFDSNTGLPQVLIQGRGVSYGTILSDGRFIPPSSAPPSPSPAKTNSRVHQR